jgi:signal transduction histidine kinase
MSVGHDLRGSIAPMRLAVQLLRSDRVMSTDRDSALQLIDQQIDRLLEGIDDLADLLRLNADAFPQRLATDDLNFATDIVCGRSSLQKTLADKQQSLRCLPAIGPVMVHHDSGRLVALLEFLIERSAAHAPVGAELTLELQPDGDRALLRIAGAGNSLATDADLAYVTGAASGLSGKPQAKAILMREIARLNGVAFDSIDEKSEISFWLPTLQQ